ncbi:MAG: response regulator [Patescibacteria group bacterium]|nr:response regulator [Patescibacteria group bacterium]MDD5715409.1 response regulator [Patescibacteria group bacterium]
MTPAPKTQLAGITDSKFQSKILLVEDDKMLADMYITKFSKEGLQVMRAEDGAKGLEVAKREKPDLVLLDIIMPKLDGFAVLKELKSDPNMSNTHILLLTNLGQSEDVEKGRELGADDYFIKANHTPAEIVEKVKYILTKRMQKE